MRVSLVIPCFNEEESVPRLLETIAESLPAIGRPGEVEVLCVDDGSTDRTFELLAEAAGTRPELRVIRLRRNFGQTAALACGIDHARGEIIVALVDNEEATLKRLRRRGDSIALEAANPAYETRLYGADRVKVQGKLVGLIRRY